VVAKNKTLCLITLNKLVGGNFGVGTLWIIMRSFSFFTDLGIVALPDVPDPGSTP